MKRIILPAIFFFIGMVSTVLIQMSLLSEPEDEQPSFVSFEYILQKLGCGEDSQVFQAGSENAKMVGELLQSINSSYVADSVMCALESSNESQIMMRYNFDSGNIGVVTVNFASSGLISNMEFYNSYDTGLLRTFLPSEVMDFFKVDSSVYVYSSLERELYIKSQNVLKSIDYR